MLEDQIIEKIERTYDQKLNHLPSIEYIQRNIFIKNLDLPQQQYLMYLIKKERNYSSILFYMQMIASLKSMRYSMKI